MPTRRMTKPPSWRTKKFCHPMAMLTAQMTRVRTLSSTIRVVAVSSFVTEIPAKLKKEIDMTVPGKKVGLNMYHDIVIQITLMEDILCLPEKARASSGLWTSW